MTIPMIRKNAKISLSPNLKEMFMATTTTATKKWEVRFSDGSTIHMEAETISFENGDKDYPGQIYLVGRDAAGQIVFMAPHVHVVFVRIVEARADSE
jgi:hypothetical protein